jgi:transposase
VPPGDRANRARTAPSASSYPLADFLVQFPDDDACMRWLWRTRLSPDGKHAYCRRCGRERVFKRYATRQRRRSWTCSGCGLHVQPTAGTIFEGSSTSLHLWFYAFYLMTSTRCAVSAKHLERELGVTYKTARRMLNLIRDQLMGREGLVAGSGAPSSPQLSGPGSCAASSSPPSTSDFSGIGMSTGS